MTKSKFKFAKKLTEVKQTTPSGRWTEGEKSQLGIGQIDTKKIAPHYSHSPIGKKTE